MKQPLHFAYVALDDLARDSMAGTVDAHTPLAVSGLIHDVVEELSEYSFYTGRLTPDLRDPAVEVQYPCAWLQLEFGSLDERTQRLFTEPSGRRFRVVGWYTSEPVQERRVCYRKPHRIGKLVVHRVDPVPDGTVLLAAPQQLYTLESRGSYPVVTSNSQFSQRQHL